MRDKVFTINDDGRICENGLVISNERIVLLLNEADFVREDLRIEKSRNDNMKISLHHFRRRCLKFEVGLKDVDSLQGRGKDSTHAAYFMEDPMKLKEKYLEYVDVLTI